jgi:2-polyprenyl-6-methoxyphenol hydroxylase-like FAD-dependent oxidoreductase
MAVVVAGGGIAGLTMALTCHQVGVPVKVFEAAAELRPLGLGIILQPEAVRELFDLGLAAELESIGFETRELALIGRDGVDVWSEPRGRDAGYRWPQYAVHRGELEMLLYRAAVDRLGSDAIVTGRRVTHYEHVLEGIRVELTTNDGAVERSEGSVLLGADGLHSAVRAQMFPGDGGPRWGGSVLWRGKSLREPIRTGSSFIVVGDPLQRFVTFPISPVDPTTGLQVQNWIAEVAFDPNRGWRRGDWNTRVSSDEFIDSFEGWQFDWLDIPDLVRNADLVFEYPMVDRNPVDHWVHGSVALIGDAAHAMYPVGSNGASQAIVDARVLGAAFVEHGVNPEALRAYQFELLDTRSALVLQNRGLGPGSILGVLDENLSTGFGHLGELEPDELQRFIADYHAVSAAAVERLNTSPSSIAT